MHSVLVHHLITSHLVACHESTLLGPPGTQVYAELLHDQQTMRTMRTERLTAI